MGQLTATNHLKPFFYYFSIVYYHYFYHHQIVVDVDVDNVVVIIIWR